MTKEDVEANPGQVCAKKIPGTSYYHLLENPKGSLQWLKLVVL